MSKIMVSLALGLFKMVQIILLVNEDEKEDE